MTTPSEADTETYAWLELDERPGALIGEASCFTFLRPVSPESVMRNEAVDEVRELDLSGVERSVEQLVESDDELNTAAFESNGWTVVFQDNGFPDQFVQTWLASPATEQGVVVFWNVNSVKEFSLWEKGEQIVTFEWPYDRDGADPDRLNDDMVALGIPLEEPPDDDEDGDEDGEDSDASYAQLMALAERLTGVHLDVNFLARPLVVGHIE